MNIMNIMNIKNIKNIRNIMVSPTEGLFKENSALADMGIKTESVLAHALMLHFSTHIFAAES